MNVYLLYYEVDETVRIDKVFVSKERAEKRLAELQAGGGDEQMDNPEEWCILEREVELEDPSP